MSRRRQKANKFKCQAESDPQRSGCEADDGIESFRSYAKPWDAPKQAGRKGRQLCEQVKDALTGAFAICGDVAVQAASVIAVDPAPHSGRLRVLVGVPADGDPGATAEALARAAGFLRGEVAAAITRRYAPELVFAVVPV